MHSVPAVMHSSDIAARTACSLTNSIPKWMELLTAFTLMTMTMTMTMTKFLFYIIITRKELYNMNKFGIVIIY